MTWSHRHESVLRAVIDAADARRDGLLPMDVAGVTETFGDELSLLGALQLRWYARLSGHLELALLASPADVDVARTVWSATAEELPGVRLVIDHYRAHPEDPRMAAALSVARAKEQRLLAAVAAA